MPAAYVRVLIRALSDSDELAQPLLEGTDLSTENPPDANATIRLWQFLQVTDNLTRAAPTWALTLKGASYASAHGAIGLACLTAPTIADSFPILTRCGHLNSPYFRLRTDQRRDFVALTVEPQVDLASESRRPLLESLLLSLQGVFEAALQRPMNGGAFDMVGPPTPTAAQYDSVFHAPVRFGAKASAIMLPRAWLSLSCPLADPLQHEAALAGLAQLERGFRREGGLVQEIERVLEQAELVPVFADMATRLGVSERTLTRRLSESGTSFRELIQMYRRRKALHLLRGGAVPIGDIAVRLGYSDPGNFARAFHRWFGVSPREYQARLRSNATP